MKFPQKINSMQQSINVIFQHEKIILLKKETFVKKISIKNQESRLCY
jgi:hypothetical protein